MFFKPFKIKSQSTIKGSDRKKLRADILQQYKEISAEDVKEIVPTKDEMSVMKLETHSLETVVVYTIEKNPMFFQIEKVIYPTVYLLWKYPHLVLTFTTWPEVFKKLLGGAALMLPGVIFPPGKERSPAALGDFLKDCGCAVRLHGNRAPVAVGRTALSSKEMCTGDLKGKAVIILHTYQDQLWQLGDKSDPPALGEEIQLPSEPELDKQILDCDPNNGKASCPSDLLCKQDASNLAEKLSDGAEMGSNAENVSSLSIVEETSDVCREMDRVAQSRDAVVEEVERESTKDLVEVEGEVTTTEDNLESMDDLLHKCFLYALKTSAKRVELPLLTSTFFRNHMVPLSPKGVVLDVKKSSFKKLSKFLAYMQQQGFIEVKELSKGVESITEIKQEHDELRSFKIPTWPLNERQEVAVERPPVAGASYNPPTITEVYLVTQEVLPLMSLSGFRKGDVMMASEVKERLTDYVRTNNLQDSARKNIVHLDMVLTPVLTQKNEYSDVLSFQDLLPRCLAKMKVAQRVSFPGKDPEIRKGQLEPILLDVLKRASNKKVTTVDNLEAYGIDLDEFSAAIQTGVSCHASVVQSNDKPKGKKQVTVQGNQIKFIEKLLKENYHVPLSYIKGLEKAPKKK